MNNDNDANDIFMQFNRTMFCDICFEFTSIAMCFRYSLRFHITKNGHIDTKQNKEEIKAFCDQFCQLMVESIQEGWIIAYFTMQVMIWLLIY